MDLVRLFLLKLRDIWLALRISNKWRRDFCELQLTAEHRQLYGIVHSLYWRELRDFPNLVNCRDFNDRIQWLKLFDQDRIIVRCSDKILMREYVRECLGDQYLVEMYQAHDHFIQIDFDSLPKSFVIKTNHDSGTVIPVRNKEMFSFQEVGERVEKALRRPYGWDNGEWAYSYIAPKVLVEEYLEPENGNTLPDYKFHCVDGEVRWLQYIYDRGSETKEVIVLPLGEITDIHFDHKMRHGRDFTLPKRWEEMKLVAERLSNPFRYVRVDLYFSDGRILVGELTFFPLMGCYKGEGQQKLGQLLDFDRTTFKPFLLKELDAERNRASLMHKLKPAKRECL